MRAAAALLTLLALVAALPAQAAKPSKPPYQLWQKYPLGNKKLAPPTQAERPKPVHRQAPASRPAPATPAFGSGSGGGGIDVPLWAVLLAVILVSSLLTLAGETIVEKLRGYRRHRWAHRPGRSWSSLREAKAARQRQKLGPLRGAVAQLEAATGPLKRKDRTLAALLEEVKEQSKEGFWRPSYEDSVMRLLTEDEMTESGTSDRVAAVLRAAEEVAERIREEAYEEAEMIRRRAEEAGEARAEQIRAEAERLRAQAEAYARDLIETAERRTGEVAGNGQPDPLAGEVRPRPITRAGQRAL